MSGVKTTSLFPAFIPLPNSLFTECPEEVSGGPAEVLRLLERQHSHLASLRQRGESR